MKVNRSHTCFCRCFYLDFQSCWHECMSVLSLLVIVMAQFAQSGLKFHNTYIIKPWYKNPLVINIKKNSHRLTLRANIKLLMNANQWNIQCFCVIVFIPDLPWSSPLRQHFLCHWRSFDRRTLRYTRQPRWSPGWPAPKCQSPPLHIFNGQEVRGGNYQRKSTVKFASVTSCLVWCMPVICFV